MSFAAVHARRLLPVAAVLLPALLACPSSPYPEGQVGAPRPAAKARPAVPPVPAPKLRFSVAAMLSPQGSYEAYSQLFELMAKRLGMEIEFIQRKTYREVNDLLLAGQVDAAIVCTGGYLELDRRAPEKIELLAVPIVGGSTTYNSYVLVPAASKAQSLRELAGKRFAFTDELSLTGRAYAIYWLKEHKADPAKFFGSLQFTMSHDRSIEAVAKGLVDGVCVDSLIYDEMVKARPELAKAVRRIDTSPPFGSPPIVASTSLAADRRAAIRDALVSMSSDEEGRRALRAIGFDGFGPVKRDHYDGARTVVRATW